MFISIVQGHHQTQSGHQRGLFRPGRPFSGNAGETNRVCRRGGKCYKTFLPVKDAAAKEARGQSF